MSLVSISNLEKTFGERVIFDKLSLTIYPGERIGFIGANGSGKTTLFKVITGQITPEHGSVSVTESCRVGYLSQDPVFEPTNTVIDEAELAFARLHELSHEMRDLEHAMAEHHDEALDKVLAKYQDVQHEFDLAGGYVWRHRLEATLLGVGLPETSWEQPVSTLSGGQRSRLALAKILISSPDLLLLDEPTNHLDLVAVEWLEKYLLDFAGAVIIISHDRYLLDRITTRIVWLNQNKISSYKGNYSQFAEQKELQELTQQRQFEEQQADIEKQKEFIRRFGAGQRSKEAKGREKRLNRLLESGDVIQAVQQTSKIKLSLNVDQRAGDQVLQVRELSKSFENKELWQNLKFHVRRGERIGIIGPNGSGKTTLLKVLIGEGDADSGELKWGASLKIGYYDQRLDLFDPDNTVMDECWGDRDVKEKQVRDTLAVMLFRGDDIYKTVGLLSGGERARLRLTQLLLDKPNVLLLDEPTNHLDIASCEALEHALKDFDGTILCVSHDRYFLDHAISRMLVLEPPNVLDFEGNYSAWHNRPSQQSSSSNTTQGKRPSEQQKPKPQQSAPAKPKPQTSNNKPQPKKADNPYSRPFGRLTLPELEREITDTEVAIAEAQSQFGGEGFKNQHRGKNMQDDYKKLTKKLEDLEAEYYLRGQ